MGDPELIGGAHLAQVEVRRRVEWLRESPGSQEQLFHLVDGRAAPIIIERGNGCAAGGSGCVIRQSDRSCSLTWSRPRRRSSSSVRMAALQKLRVREEIRS